MKINNATSAPISKKKSSQEEINNRLKEKFGSKIKTKKPEPAQEPAAKAEEIKQNFNVNQVATVGENAPDSEVTQDKLREILKTGAFDFNQKERKVLANILK